MKANTLRMLAGVTAPPILTGSVQAGFLGIKVVSKPNQFGLLVRNIYAEFDRPGRDFFSLSAGTGCTVAARRCRSDRESATGTPYRRLTPTLPRDMHPAVSRVRFSE